MWLAHCPYVFCFMRSGCGGTILLSGAVNTGDRWSTRSQPRCRRWRSPDWFRSPHRRYEHPHGHHHHDRHSANHHDPSLTSREIQLLRRIRFRIVWSLQCRAFRSGVENKQPNERNGSAVELPDASFPDSFGAIADYPGAFRSCHNQSFYKKKIATVWGWALQYASL